MLSTLHFGKFLPFTKVPDCSEEFAGGRRRKLVEEPGEKFTNVTETRDYTSHSHDMSMAETSSLLPSAATIQAGHISLAILTSACSLSQYVGLENIGWYCLGLG